ncbi:MAG: TetR/AcrR family transcriptional regulator [Thermoleophilaceae bacterium]
MPAQRLTRKERQERTRSLLMASAAAVFSDRGMEGASIDEVAEHAGFTKGAFYANFESKEQLFLAMLEANFADRLEEIDRALGTEEEPEAQARQAGLDFHRFLEFSEEWERLFFEFAAYASRNEEFRAELVARYRMLRDRVAQMMARRAEEIGVEPPVEMDELTLMTFAMANGVALERLLEPEAVPHDLYGSMLEIFFIGLRAKAEGFSSSESTRRGQ